MAAARGVGAALLLVGTLLLGACISDPSYLEPARHDASVGKTKAEVLAAFGEPDEAAVAGDQESLSYVYDRVVLYGPSGPATATAYYCRVTFLLAGDRVTAVDTEGKDCGRR